MSRRVLWTLGLLAFSVAAFRVSGQERGRGRGGAAAPLPEGPGKAIVETQCASCHSVNLISNSGYSRDEWTSLFTTMVARIAFLLSPTPIWTQGRR